MNHELEIIRLRKELSEFSRRAFNRGLVSGTGGNLSVRIPGTDTALITPTGICLGDIDPEINLLMKIDGTVIENPAACGPPRRRPSIWRSISSAPKRGRSPTSIPPMRRPTLTVYNRFRWSRFRPRPS